MLVNPPSTGMTAPVTNEEAFSEASQRSAPDNSPGSPYLAIGVWKKSMCAVLPLKFFYSVQPEKIRHDGVDTNRMRRHSRARNLVILFTPAFEIEYVKTRDNGSSDETR